MLALSYPDAIAFQLEAWRKGKPWHNPVTPSRYRGGGGECCPDFSCCYPHLLAPTVTRETFARAGWKLRQEMLGMFLGGLVQSAKASVHIAGQQSERSH